MRRADALRHDRLAESLDVDASKRGGASFAQAEDCARFFGVASSFLQPFCLLEQRNGDRIGIDRMECDEPYRLQLSHELVIDVEVHVGFAEGYAVLK